MFCPNCGNQVNDNASFCERCGNKLKQESMINRGNIILTPGISWCILAICFLMLIVGLSFLLSYDKIEGLKDLIVPIIFSLISLGASVFVLSYSKQVKNADLRFKGIYTVSIIVTILSAILAVEVCVGPFIGELTKK